VLKRLLREPLFHFFVVGVLLFAAHRAVKGADRSIEITAGVRADLLRRFQDEAGRPPTAAEAERALGDWKRAEALYREALRQGLDRNDAAVRSLLIDKLRAQALQQAPVRNPSEQDLQAWLALHRDWYTSPRRYRLEWLSFDKANAAANRNRANVAAALASGVDRSKLGQPVFGAEVTEEELRQRLGERVAAEVPALKLGEWRESESASALLLVRVEGAEGGLPALDELRPRLSADWTAAQRKRLAEQALDGLVARYRYEESQ